MRASVLLSCIQFAISYSLNDPPRKDDAIVPSAPSALEAEHLPTASPAKSSAKEVRVHPLATEQVPSPSAGSSFLGRPSAAPDAVMPTENHPTATPANSSVKEVRPALASAPEREDGLEADLLEPEAPAPPRLGALAQLRQEPTAFAQLRQEMPARAQVEASKVATKGEASGSLSRSKSKTTELETSKEQVAAEGETSGSLSKSKSKSSKVKKSPSKLKATQNDGDDDESSPTETEKRHGNLTDGFSTVIFFWIAIVLFLVLILVAVFCNKDFLRPRYRRNRQGFEVAKGGGGPSSGGLAGVSGKGWGS